MKPRYGYGWKPDPSHAPRMGGEALLRTVDPVPSKDDHLLVLAGDVFDQGQTSSCFAQASAKCIEVALRLRGVFELPSRRAIYNMGRVAEGMDAFALTDDGTVPMYGVQAMAKWGVCPEMVWPWNDNQINEPIPWDVTEQAATAIVTGWEKLPLNPDEVKLAITSGYPVMFGMPVDMGYENYSGGLYPGRTGPSLGNHMQTILAFDGDVFKIMGSWSKDFGEDGFANMPASWLFGGQCSDFYALEAAPVGLKR
jgi:hypothetical protein